MNKLIVSVASLLISISMIGCESKKDPVEYNNEVITVVNSSEEHVNAMNSAMNNKEYPKAIEVQKAWKVSIEEDIKQIEKIGDFNGDKNLKEAVLSGLRGYQKIVEEDYPKLIEIRTNGTDNIEAERTLLNNINEAFEKMAIGVNKASDQFEKDYHKP